MSNKYTNINYKNYFDLVETLLKLDKISNFLLSFIDYVLANITFSESSIYLYDSEGKLENIIKESTSGSIQENIDHLVEGGIFEWTKNTKQIAVFPQMNTKSDIQRNLLIIPLSHYEKVIGYSISITEMNLDELSPHFEEIMAYSTVFSFFIHSFINREKPQNSISNSGNTNYIKNLILNSIHNSNKILYANLTLLNNNIGNSSQRQGIINLNLEKINVLNKMYDKYSTIKSNVFTLKELFDDIEIIDKDYLNEHDTNLIINEIEFSGKIRNSIYDYSYIILKILNLPQNKETKKRVISIKANKSKSMQFKPFIAINIDDNGIFYETAEKQYRETKTNNIELEEIRTYISAIHGHIKVKSEFDSGTNYQIFFPL